MSIYRKSVILPRNETFFFCEEQTLYGSARLGTEQVEHSMRGLVTKDALTDEITRAREQHGDNWQQHLQQQYDGQFYERLQEAWGNEWSTRLDLVLQGNNDGWLIEQIRNESYTLQAGNKRYELSNHLGNVLAVVSDKKEQSDGVTWSAIVVSAQDYFPFGMAMPGRSTDAKHRYGFNGKETDPETRLEDFGARLYDNRLGRWLSPDPLEAKLPGWSTYTFAFNRVMMYTDPTGMIGEPVNNKPATDGVISTKTTRSVSLLSQVHFMESAPDRPSVYTVRQITTTTTTVLERKDNLYYSTTTTTTESFQQSILFSNDKDHFVATPYPPETASSTTVTKDKTNGFGTREHLGTSSTTHENAVIQPYRQTLEVLYGVEYKQLLATGITTAQGAAKGSEKIGKNVDKATSGARIVGALVPIEYVPIANYAVLPALALARYSQLVEQTAANNSKGLVRSHNLDNVNLTKVLDSNPYGRHRPAISLLK